MGSVRGDGMDSLAQGGVWPRRGPTAKWVWGVIVAVRVYAGACGRTLVGTCKPSAALDWGIIGACANGMDGEWGRGKAGVR